MSGRIITHSSSHRGIIIACIFLTPGLTRAGVVTWDVDPAASFIRLTVPDQTVNAPGIGDVVVRLRDASSTTQWTDAGGRRAAVDGSIVTDYTDSTSIAFLAGAQNLYALEQTSLRPNPAEWDAATTNYVGTGTALAAFGARVRGTYSILTFDVAFLALRQVRFDIGSGALPVVGGNFPGGQNLFGISSALGDVDGLALPLGLGQPVPDLLGAQLSPIVDTNSMGGVIEDLGGWNRKLTCTVSVPISIQVDTITLTGSAAGEIVAYATLPEQPVLRIFQGTDETVVVAWPASASTFVLEENSVLSPTNWTPVTNTPVGVGSEKQVTLSTSPLGAFYRLRGQ
jgi:hypothetical protein